jgi:3-keto-disaccharide hydrolase
LKQTIHITIVKNILSLMVSLMILWIGTADFVHAEDPVFSKEGQFEKLFDGKTLNDWVVEGAEECWLVNRQRLCCIADKKGKWIRTKSKQSEFILKFEWKIGEGGESGLLLGLNPNNSVHKNTLRIPIVNQLKDNLHCTGSIEGIAPVNMQPDTSPERWHTMKIQCLLSGITIICDGKKCTHLDSKQLNSKLKYPLEGYIAFQAVTDVSSHGIQFRDIQIQKRKLTK